MGKDKNNSNKPMDSKEYERIGELLRRLEVRYPMTKSALNYENPFELLIATILAAQCTDIRVNKVTAHLFKKYRGPGEFAQASQEELEEDIKTCGLFRNKSKNIIATSKMLLENYSGQVPADFDELIKLPGVGRKTANVVLSNAFDIPAFAVDTHVYRLAKRLGLSDHDNILRVEQDLMEKVPKDMWIDAHRWLIYYGREVCSARRPKCDHCELEDLCPSSKKKISDTR